LTDILGILEQCLKKTAKVRFTEKERGDVDHSHADIRRAHGEFGYTPTTPVEEGLRREADWLVELAPKIDLKR
jgi:UDP-glucuronate 4-epimerase